MASDKLWGGRFQEKPDPSFESFSRSFQFDHALWKEDLAVLKAHVSTLTETKTIKPETGKKILSALETLEGEIQSGHLPLSGNHEDIHSFIEEALKKRVGEDASLIRLGRSRNDTVVTDLRLHLKQELLEILNLHLGYLEALLALANRFKTTVIPAYTHFRRAQPVLFPFYCLSWIAAGKREREALEFALQWTDVSALGAGAVSGTGWPIDVPANAAKLGFSFTFSNALDATGDRDFLLAFHFSASLLMTHLSRLCEDLILWSSEALGYVELPESLCTGSSLMPQKKNPDALELIRGKSARLFGHLTSLFMLLKGLPSGYNRDLQEDKEPVFDGTKTVKEVLVIMTQMVKGITINEKALAKIWEDDSPVATDYADELVKQGHSFAEAHDLTGKTILNALQKGGSKRVFKEISIEKSAQKRETYGGTGEKAVARALTEAAAWLKLKQRDTPGGVPQK